MLCVVGFSHAQKWGVVNNINHVFDIDEFADKFYFSTWGGVAVAEGSSGEDISEMNVVEHYTTSMGLISNDIRSITLADMGGDLWMGSSSDGITVERKGNLITLGSNLNMPFQEVKKIVDNGQYVYVATDRGLAQFYTLEEVSFPLMLHNYTQNSTGGGIADNDLDDLLITPPGMVYVSHRLGISYAHIDSLSHSTAWKSHNILLGHKNIIFAANDEYVALCYSQQGKVYQKKHSDPDSQWSLVPITTEAGNIQISAFYLDDNNDIWLGFGDWNEDSMRYDKKGEHLMSRYNLSSGEQIDFKAGDFGLGAKVISKIKRLPSGLYFASWGDGIARYDESEFKYYKHNSLAFQKISQIIPDLQGKYWFNSGVIGDTNVRKGTMGVCSHKDGFWEAFDTDNSRLHSNNILALGVDSKNRKWFGAWDTTYSASGNHNGLTIYDDSDGSWEYLTKRGKSLWNDELGTWGITDADWIPGSPRILNNTIAAIYKDRHDYVHVLCYDGGVSVLDPDDNVIASFTMPGSTRNRVTVAYHNGRQYFYGTEYDVGLKIWNNDSIPTTPGSHWVSQMPTDLKSGKIYAIESVVSPYGGMQHFIASGNGLYMWDETNWYKYGAYIKRQRYNFTTNSWENNMLYYEDEERIFGSISTYPISITSDPFNRIWIGSDDHGMSMFDLRRERFVNYYQDNSPLISNTISALAYDPETGNLLIGTPDGMNTFKIGIVNKPDVPLGALKIFPNPFSPDGNNFLMIKNSSDENMPKGTNNCRIFDSNGTLIADLKETILAEFEWDGKNKAGTIVSSGIYFVVVTDEKGNTQRGKFAIIR